METFYGWCDKYWNYLYEDVCWIDESRVYYSVRAVQLLNRMVLTAVLYYM